MIVGGKKIPGVYRFSMHIVVLSDFVSHLAGRRSDEVGENNWVEGVDHLLFVL